MHTFRLLDWNEDVDEDNDYDRNEASHGASSPQFIPSFPSPVIDAFTTSALEEDALELEGVRSALELEGGESVVSSEDESSEDESSTEVMSGQRVMNQKINGDSSQENNGDFEVVDPDDNSFEDSSLPGGAAASSTGQMLSDVVRSDQQSDLINMLGKKQGEDDETAENSDDVPDHINGDSSSSVRIPDCVQCNIYIFLGQRDARRPM